MYKSGSNNQVIIKGEIVEEFAPYSWEGELKELCKTTLKVERLSSECDYVPVVMTKSMAESKKVGQTLAVLGEYRSRNIKTQTKSKLELVVLALSELETSSVLSDASNIVSLTGFVCKNVIYRTTPFGRDISDILLAVNRGHNKSDYIPCIAWSTNALVASKFVVGDMLSIIGRIQSRVYHKKLDSGEIEDKIAYEISIIKIEKLKNSERERLKDFFTEKLENVVVKYNANT